MFTETAEPDSSILMGSQAFISDPAIENEVFKKSGLDRIEAISDPVEKGADKIIEFVDGVTSLPQRLESTARDLNDYLISVGERIAGESEEKARENLGGFKISDTIQTTAESAGAWIRNNWMIVLAVAVAIFIFRR